MRQIPASDGTSCAGSGWDLAPARLSSAAYPHARRVPIGREGGFSTKCSTKFSTERPFADRLFDPPYGPASRPVGSAAGQEERRPIGLRSSRYAVGSVDVDNDRAGRHVVPGALAGLESRPDEAQKPDQDIG